jgi:hypothetical protein
MLLQGDDGLGTDPLFYASLCYRDSYGRMAKRIRRIPTPGEPGSDGGETGGMTPFVFCGLGWGESTMSQNLILGRGVKNVGKTV